MNNKKNILKIGTLLAILMFLLIPLLSSPVAAAFSQYLGSVTTGNTGGGGPTATGSGSDHWMEIVVWWQPGGSGPLSGPNIYTQNKIYIAANGGQMTGRYTTTPLLTGYGGKGTNFWINVTVYCDDLSDSGPVSWNSGNNTMSIV